jgi:predicted acetyltransferase
MTPVTSRSDLPAPLAARRANTGDDPALDRLWQLFRHEMSTITRALPGPDGRYRCDRLDLALDPGRPEWEAWLLRAAEHPVGFALTRSLDEPVRVLNSLFVVAPARRGGVGLRFARDVVDARPGVWEVAHQDVNSAAATFWERLASLYGPGWGREHRAVPGRPDLPPDVWVRFVVP